MKRVTVFGPKKLDGKVFLIPETFDEFLGKISLKFDINASRIFTKNGGEIDSLDLIIDNDILYVTEGENFNEPTSSWVTLNVGGKYFTTSRTTLTDREPTCMLARMFSATQTGEFLYQPSQVDHKKAFLIDRSPTYFEPILNYLRNGQIIVDPNLNLNGVLTEAKYYGIESMIPELQAQIQQSGKNEACSLNRNDVTRALITTPITSNLRFQGVNLQGADLSKLDLRFINFKYANLAKCNLNLANLSWCCLERADLSFTNLQNAQLLGVKSLCANFEGAHLQGCNFEDPGGVPANLEGCNLKGAVLEGSNMTGVNLRVATLKNANLKNCDLRAAVLAGADLECCDLSGSDLQEANLRGANLKDAAFELMLTPLHMSQTIR